MSVPKIVIIEDNPADVRLFRYVLDETGEDYDLEILSDGAEALRFIQQHAQAYDPCVIVLDMHLPRYDGIAVLTAIRSMPALAHVDVVALTSMASPREDLAIRALGVTLYQEKPCGFDELRFLAAEIFRICHEASIKTAA